MNTVSVNNKVITFANQKGGVGKSTIAVLYANHLSTLLGKEDFAFRAMNVFDLDAQKSIVSTRNADIENWSEQPKYAVEYIGLSNFQQSERFMLECKQLMDVITVIDVPGNITDDYLAPVFLHSDFIVCPYQYERKVLESCSTFIKVIMAIKRKMPEVMKATLIFVPNRYDKRIGTITDILQQKETDNVFGKYGEVTAKIPERKEFKGINTYFNTSKQETDAKPAFSDLDRIMFKRINNF